MNIVAHSQALEASHVLATQGATLGSLFGFNSKASEQYIQLHDTAALPGDGAVPIATFIVPARSNFSLDFPLFGLPFLNGITVCNSSTPSTKTIGSADCFFTAVVR